jgi:hypothetical protein
VGSVTAAHAQGGDTRVNIVLPQPGNRGKEAPTVRSLNLLASAHVRDMLVNGFRARIHYTLSLWKQGGFFSDDERDREEWDVFVWMTGLDKKFVVTRLEEDNRITSLGSFATLAEADAALSRPFLPAMYPPHGGGSYYYAVTMDMQVLTASDLDELERWMRGAGKASAPTAIGSGVRTLMKRLLGDVNIRRSAQSPTFRADS